MTITTNYSRSDWKKAIPRTVIVCIPAIFLFWAVFNIWIPFIENFTTFLNYQTEDELLVRFINHVIDNEELQTGYLVPDGWLLFFAICWSGAMIFPMWLIWKFYKIIPTDWIVKKLGIENRMKLVVFKNGKPVRKIRDLLK